MFTAFNLRRPVVLGLACALSLAFAAACSSDAHPGTSGTGGGTNQAGSGGASAGAGDAPSTNEQAGEGGALLGEAGAEQGEGGALADPDLESPSEQQAIIARTQALPEPRGSNSAANEIVARVTGPSVAPEPGTDDPDSYYGCAQKGAAHAYPARRVTGESICANVISAGSLTNKLLVADKHDGLLVAFAGTQLSLTHPGDVGRDLESQAVISHENPLFEHSDATAALLPLGIASHSSGSVGRGWEARWRSQLKEANAAALYLTLKQLSNEAAYSGVGHRALTVTVVGHSLGAVVAELAAYDIYDYLSAKGVRFHVRVVAFNPPKLGTEAFVEGYRYRLLQGPGMQSLELSQFSRSYDPVPKVPLFLSHPAWDTDVGSKVIGDGSSDELPYCPQYALDVFHLPLAAHSIVAWATDISEMPAESQCLFGSALSAADF